MGMTRDSNDILNRPPIAFNPNRATPYVNYSSATLTQSATSSLTAISIQGPGVITHFSLFPAATQKGTVKMLIDGNTAFSASSAVIAVGSAHFSGMHLIGTWQLEAAGVLNIRYESPVAFETNFTVMYEFPEHSTTYAVSIYYAYRLAE